MNDEMRLFNTLSGRVETLAPVAPPEVGFYTCGPTVYNRAHVGNFRTLVTTDVLRRSLRHLGYRVREVMNVTDVDDRIIQKAQEAGTELREFTAQYIRAFEEDMATLLGSRADQALQRFRLYPVGGGDDVAVPGVEPGDLPVGWTADGRGIFVVPRQGGRATLRVMGLDAQTGARAPWREIRPPDPVGVVGLEGLRVTPDAKAYVYNIRRIVSTLFVVEGLK